MESSLLIDTHCHLFMQPLDCDIEGVLKRAGMSGVSAIIVPSVETGSWARTAELAYSYPVIHPAFGLHPWCAGERLDIDLLRKLLIETEAVAIGEIGLDFKVEDSDRDTQIEVFRTQLDLAVELALPVILHCRGAFSEMLSILSEKKYSTGITGVIHAFSRGIQLAERFLELGLYIAFGGAVTRPRARRARESAALVPIDRIILETDAPSIGMDGVDCGSMEPAHVKDICMSFADIRGVSFKEAASETSRNAGKLFGISYA